MKRARQTALQLRDIVGPALGSLFFIPHPVIGILVWGAFALNPLFALFALVGLGVGEAMGYLLRTRDEVHLGGDLRTNALLAAVAVAWLCTGAPDLALLTQLVMAAGAAAAAAVFAAVFERALKPTVLPGLVWAYCLVAGLLFMLFPGWVAGAVEAMQPWPEIAGAAGWLSVFLHSLGVLLFSPGIVAGSVVVLATLAWSRSMFATGVTGWAAGVIAAMAFQDLGLGFDWGPVSYNFFLAGMGVGAVFFLPGRMALPMAVLGGCVAAFFALVLQHLMPGSSVPYLPVSAMITIWLGVAALARNTGKSVLWRNHTPWLPPEDAWARAAYWYARFGRDEPLFAMPVAGPLRIAQGFDGPLSHAGAWRHALDFQRPDTVAEGDAIWEAPVISPAAGVVERTRNNVVDNALGVSNYAENWGNHVVVKLDEGGYALMAHLRQSTVAVATGGRVETGTYVGEVGNSGRSPVPHLHLQAQNAAEPGAHTIPFRMANYLSAHSPGDDLNEWHDAGVPREGDIVMGAPSNPPVHDLLAGMAPGSAVWTIEADGTIPAAFRERAGAGSVRLRTTLDEAGRHVLQMRDGGRLVTSLAPDAWRMVEPHDVTAPLLRLLSLAVPSLPYAAFDGLIWDEPAPLVPSGPAGWLGLAVLPYRRQVFPLVRCACHAVPDARANMIEIETRVQTPPPDLPHKIITRLEPLRGPVSIAAEFKNGKLAYTLMSFEPGMPLDTGDRR